MTTETYAGAADAVAALAEPPYYAIIHPWSAVTFVHGKPTLADLQRAVGGDIEPLPIDIIQTHGEAITAYCNERGKIDGMRPNPVATRVLLGATADVWCIAGPVVIIGGPDADGEDTPLSAEWRMRLVREIAEA